MRSRQDSADTEKGSASCLFLLPVAGTPPLLRPAPPPRLVRAATPTHNARMIRDPATPTLFQRRVYGTIGLTLLVGLYLLVGLTSHDPWRGDDARHVGPVLAMLRATPTWDF